MNDPIWTGRLDEDTAGDTRRLHQVVQPFDATVTGGSALIGFACDEGVRRNHGRIGAAQGPYAIRRMLANLPAHRITQLADAGNVVCDDGDLERAQQRLAERIAQVMGQGNLPLILGGGHEVAYGSFLGITRHLGATLQQRKLLIINFDAHFDLRTADCSTSGTPFLQMAQWCEQAKVDFRYVCYGISELGNTPALFNRARQLDVQFHMDRDVAERSLDIIDQELRTQLDGVTDVLSDDRSGCLARRKGSRRLGACALRHGIGKGRTAGGDDQIQRQADCRRYRRMQSDLRPRWHDCPRRGTAGAPDPATAINQDAAAGSLRATCGLLLASSFGCFSLQFFTSAFYFSLYFIYRPRLRAATTLCRSSSLKPTSSACAGKMVAASRVKSSAPARQFAGIIRLAHQYRHRASRWRLFHIPRH